MLHNTTIDLYPNIKECGDISADFKTWRAKKAMIASFYELNWVCWFLGRMRLKQIAKWAKSKELQERRFLGDARNKNCN